MSKKEYPWRDSNPQPPDYKSGALYIEPQGLGFYFVSVAQWIAHQTSDLGVGGSSPPWDLYFFLPDVQDMFAPMVYR